MAVCFRSQYLFILLLLTNLEIVKQDKENSIYSPSDIEGSIGEDALFMWNTTEQNEILAVSWGIRKGNIPDPQFINTNKYDGKVNINEDIDAALKKRVEFIGNLTIGRAWFVLKNLTVNDTNEYIASISDELSSALPYYVRLMVRARSKVTPTEGPSPTPDTTASAPNIT
ncbi:uncharacterized protein LOC116292878, partial [Actinia tenebrosa]|uniref:Uncharacterized protein LOC116292878 n=1 Tax=Actinia tenebrosa TaxID=6105 RepID=A0A6P8HJT8_ACTTE